MQIGLHVGWIGLLGLLAVALFGPVRLRTTVSSAAGGAAVGVFALLVSLIGVSVSDSGVMSLFGGNALGLYSEQLDASQGPGLFCAALAALLAVGTAVLAFRTAPGALPALPGYPSTPAGPADAIGAGHPGADRSPGAGGLPDRDRRSAGCGDRGRRAELGR